MIRICNDIIDEMYGAEEVAKVFSEELGIPVGATTPDGKISLEYTACIGMSDQAPAILVNDVVMTYMSGDGRARLCARCANTGIPTGWSGGSETGITRTRWSARWCTTASARPAPWCSGTTRRTRACRRRWP